MIGISGGIRFGAVAFIAALTFGAVCPVSAQRDRGLTEGARVRLKLESETGHLVGTLGLRSRDSLVLRHEAGGLIVFAPIAAIREVQLSLGQRRAFGEGALIGLIAGAGLSGAAAVAGGTQYHGWEGRLLRAVAVSAGVGAAIGFGRHRDRWQTSPPSEWRPPGTSVVAEPPRYQLLPGATIRVRLADPAARPLIGTLVRLTADTLIVGVSSEQPSTAVWTVPRASVEQLDVRTGTTRRAGRGALWGAGVGALTGIVLGVVTAKTEGCGFIDFTCYSAEEGASFWGFGLGAIGAGIGALAAPRVTRWLAVPSRSLILDRPQGPGSGSRLSLGLRLPIRAGPSSRAGGPGR